MFLFAPSEPSESTIPKPPGTGTPGACASACEPANSNPVTAASAQRRVLTDIEDLHFCGAHQMMARHPHNAKVERKVASMPRTRGQNASAMFQRTLLRGS